MLYSILNSNYFVVLFYAIVVLLIILNRKKFVWQGIIGMRQTKKGIKTIDRVGRRNKKAITIIARIGSFIALIGIILMFLYLFKGLISLFITPEAPPAVSPLLPGVKIPGTNIKLPLIESFIAIIIAVIIHEFSHGIVARSHGLKAKSTGIALIGPLPAAFVELDEKRIERLKPIKQIDIFAAGPWSNIILAVIAFLFVFGITTALSPLMPPTGFTIIGIDNNSPAMNANISIGDNYFMINNVSIYNQKQFIEALKDIKPGELVEMRGMDKEGRNKTVVVTAGKKEEDPDKGYLGILVEFHYANEDKAWAQIIGFIISIIYWTGIISLGLGLANLLPISILDGGRILRTILSKKRHGIVIYNTISWITGILLILNLVLPLFL
ncbi:site-2 protease family protein [Candidatus Woesearchaeota archaeon]|nr:site-2 protease family protein [Candidatus Woesearchaeota archaeon]